MPRLLPLAVFLILGVAALVSSAGADTPALVASNPSWAPDGRQLAFTGRVGGYPPDIYAAAVDGSDLRDLTPDDPAGTSCLRGVAAAV